MEFIGNKRNIFGVYTKQYVKWLEDRVNTLSKRNISQQRKIRKVEEQEEANSRRYREEYDYIPYHEEEYER